MKMLNVLNKKGQTIILVTHDIKVAAGGKRVVYIADGRIADEIRFTDDETHQVEHREDELMNFLQQRGW